MSEELKRAIMEMTKETDGNPEARAFLEGVKYGLKYGRKSNQNMMEGSGSGGYCANSPLLNSAT